MWWLGDWLVFGERKWGEKYSEAMQNTGYAYETCRMAKHVAERIESVRRLTNLRWRHHQEIASLEPSEQDELLAKAAMEEWGIIYFIPLTATKGVNYNASMLNKKETTMRFDLIHLDRQDSVSDNRKTFCGIRINQILDQVTKTLSEANCIECLQAREFHLARIVRDVNPSGRAPFGWFLR